MKLFREINKQQLPVKYTRISIL